MHKEEIQLSQQPSLTNQGQCNPPVTTSNHLYTHCNLDVHPLDPATMWAISSLWWSVLLPCTLFINNLITNQHYDNSHLHRMWRHDTFVYLFTLHMVASTWLLLTKSMQYLCVVSYIVYWSWIKYIHTHIQYTCTTISKMNIMILMPIIRMCFLHVGF